MSKTLYTSYPEYRKKGGKVYRPEYKRAISHYLEHVKDRLFEGYPVYLPKLGEVRIVGFKPDLQEESKKWRQSLVNWPATNAMWEEYPSLRGRQFVYFLNEHSNGYVYFLRFKPSPRIRNLTTYKMKTTEAFKKRLYQEVKNGREYINK